MLLAAHDVSEITREVNTPWFFVALNVANRPVNRSIQRRVIVMRLCVGITTRKVVPKHTTTIMAVHIGNDRCLAGFASYLFSNDSRWEPLEKRQRIVLFEWAIPTHSFRLSSLAWPDDSSKPSLLFGLRFFSRP